MPMQDKGVFHTTILEFEFLAVKLGRFCLAVFALEIHHARTQVDFWINGLQLDMTLWE